METEHERRRVARRTQRVLVRVRAGLKSYDGVALNLSAGGAFVEVERLLELRTTVQLDFSVDGIAVRAHGIVVRSIDPSLRSSYTAGAAVAFAEVECGQGHDGLAAFVRHVSGCGLDTLVSRMSVDFGPGSYRPGQWASTAVPVSRPFSTERRRNPR